MLVTNSWLNFLLVTSSFHIAVTAREYNNLHAKWPVIFFPAEEPFSPERCAFSSSVFEHPSHTPWMVPSQWGLSDYRCISAQPLVLNLSLYQWDAVSCQFLQCNPSFSWPHLSEKCRPQSCKCSPVPGLRHHGQYANGSGPESLQVKENLTWKIALLVLSVFSVLIFFSVCCNPHLLFLYTYLQFPNETIPICSSLFTRHKWLYIGCWVFNLSSSPAKPYFLWSRDSLSSALNSLIRGSIWEYYRLNKLQIASCQWSNILAKFTVKIELPQALNLFFVCLLK